MEALHCANIITRWLHYSPRNGTTQGRGLVCMTTDSEFSDGNIAEAMRPLRDLLVWVVVRLCTNYETVVECKLPLLSKSELCKSIEGSNTLDL